MKLIVPACLAITLAACSQEPEAELAYDEPQGTVQMEMGEDSVDVVTTRGAGTVMATDVETSFVTLDHEAIPAIQMGAMRMPFDVTESVDLAPYVEGDAVIFDLEASEETGLLITRMCRPATDGADCLDD